MLLVIDNYDSFTFNLVQYLGELAPQHPIAADLRVHRNDELDLAAIQELRPDAILLSPGPGDPDPTLPGSSPPQDDADHDRHNQDRSDSDRDPVKGTTGRETTLGGIPEAELETDTQHRGRELDQKKHAPGQMNQSADRHADGSRTRNEPRDQEHPDPMAVVEVFDLKDAFGMGMFAKPVGADQPTAEASADEEPTPPKKSRLPKPAAAELGSAGSEWLPNCLRSLPWRDLLKWHPDARSEKVDIDTQCNNRLLGDVDLLTAGGHIRKCTCATCTYAHEIQYVGDVPVEHEGRSSVW